MYRPRFSGPFKKGRKRAAKRGKDLTALNSVMTRLTAGERLEMKFHDHKLSGAWRDCRECHIAPDWLLVYRIVDNEIEFLRTGTHSDLFE